MKPLAGGAAGGEGDRVHRPLDQRVAGGGVHPDPADGRASSGRLFREFAVTLSVAIGVSLVVSLTTTPMMCAMLLKPHDRGAARPALPRQRVGVRLDPAAATSGRCASVLRHQLITLLVTLATIAFTVYLYVDRAQGLLPAAGHRPADRADPGRPGHVVPGDERSCWTQFADDRRRGPGGGQRDRLHRRAGAASTNTASMFVALKPLDAAEDQRRRGDRPPPRQARQHPRRDPLPPAGAGPAHRRPGQRRPVPVHAAGRRPQGTQRLGPARCWPRCASCPGLADVNSDQQNRGLAGRRS